MADSAPKEKKEKKHKDKEHKHKEKKEKTPRDRSPRKDSAGTRGAGTSPRRENTSTKISPAEQKPPSMATQALGAQMRTDVSGILWFRSSNCTEYYEICTTLRCCGSSHMH